MSDDFYRQLVSGARRGLIAALMRGALQCAALAYGLGVSLRNLAYTWRLRRAERAGVPVISLGNLTAGGTGKTPLAAFVARWFRTRGVRVCLLSRGYGAAPGAANDEALVLERQCPDVPHLQHPDRLRSARIAVEELDAQLLILDDGFQHRRLARDLDVVLIDVLAPWGYGRLLPRGLLRERRSGLRRADLVVLTRVDQAPTAAVQALEFQIARLCPAAPIVSVAFVPTRLVNASGNACELVELAGQHVAAFCGIGHPEAFAMTLSQVGLLPAAFRNYPDHHLYTREDIDALRQWSTSLPAQALVTTEKDLVKIGVDRIGAMPLWALEIEARVVSGAELLEKKLAAVLSTVSDDRFSAEES